MSASISADDAMPLALLLVSEPSAKQLFYMRDTLVELGTSFHNDWLRRNWLAMEPALKDLGRLKRLTKQIADLLSPNVSQLSAADARHVELQASLVCNMLSEQMRTRRLGGLLEIETVTEGP